MRRAALVWALVLAAAGWAVADTSPRMPRERIVRTAARIVHGTVVEVSEGRDASGTPSTWVTLDVARTLKGESQSRVTFKQIGVSTPLADGAVAWIVGLPSYRIGDEVVLFLRGESMQGFTSPVGFAQGAYRVARDRGGARVSDGAGDIGQPLEQLLADVERLVASP
jgi:hypothetical protein